MIDRHGIFLFSFFFSFFSSKSTNITANRIVDKRTPAATTYTTVVSIAFSAQSSANTTQDIVDSCTVKVKKGLYGPRGGNNVHGFIFVDDLNMPQKEDYGAQPPLELIRQVRMMIHVGRGVGVLIE